MMLSTQLFDLMLDFGPEWKVSNVEANFLEMIVDITIEYLPKKGVDPESNQICPIYDYMEYRRWRHLNIMQYQTYICMRVCLMDSSLIPAEVSKYFIKIS